MNIRYVSLTLALLLFTGCGGSSSSSTQNDGKGDIDFATYYPAKSMTKTFLTTWRDGEESKRSHYDQIVEVTGQTITFTENTNEVEKVVISDTNITRTYDNKSSSMFRHVDIGDTISSTSVNEVLNSEFGKTTINTVKKCKLINKLEQFEKGDNKYVGDLLKIECLEEGTSVVEVKAALANVVRDDINGSHTIYDKSYFYFKKGLGLVADVNNDCVPNSELNNVDDNERECAKEKYEYEFYLP